MHRDSKWPDPGRNEAPPQQSATRPPHEMASPNAGTSKQHVRRINLVAGAILTGVTILVGVATFMVMARHTEEVLSRSLQLSLQDRVRLLQTEIEAGVDRTTLIAAGPMLTEQVQRVVARTDDAAARLAIETVVQSLLPTGFTAIALLDQGGRTLAQAGSFSPKPEGTVRLRGPDRVQLAWDKQLMLRSEVDITHDGRVIGRVATQMPLEGTTAALNDVGRLGRTGELALCASLGSTDMHCFPTVLSPGGFTLPKRSAQGVPLPMTHALEGKSGFVTATDYRGQQVVAAYAPVGGLGPGMVLKMDSTELFAPVWAQVRYLVPLLVGLLALALMLLHWGLRPLVNRLIRSEARANEMNASLRDSERRGRALLDNVDEGIVTLSESGQIEVFNPAAERMFGYRSQEAVGRNVSMLVPPRYRSDFDDYFARYRARPDKVEGGETPVGFQLKALRSDGTVFPADLRISEFSLEGRRHFIGSLRDITEQRRITEALRSSETQLRQIADTVPALITQVDLEERFQFHNKAYEELLGLGSGQIDGHTLAEVLGPHSYADIKGKVEEVLNGYPVQYERVLTTPQGDPRNYSLHFLPRYGEDGANRGKVIGFYGLGTDITELKRIDRMKTEFVSTVSHELRTPLTSIRGSLGLLSGGIGGQLPQAVKNLIAIAESNCERLIRLINDILDSEKIEAGSMRMDLQVVDLKQVIRQALSAVEGFALKHRVTMHLQAPEETLNARIDSDRMIQVLTNLLSNAVKFSPPDGKVAVSVTRAAGGLRIEVADQGPGIPEAFRGRIFQKFSQADSSDARRTGGTGLGLNISKALVEQMGGQLGVLSTPGAGATFFIELPQWRDEGQSPPDSPAPAARPRILICEGDLDVARLIGIMLDRAGFDFDVAQGAGQAMDRLASTRYDAVTLEPKLRDPHGETLIGALRADPTTRRLPVVIISAMAEEGRLQFRLGPLAVSDWLEKPIDEHLLVASVRRAVNGMASGRPRILHVEDDPDIQRVVQALAHDFADFEFAGTLELARTRLRAQRFDLVLLDLALGQDSGWDLIEDINALDSRPPVIVFSASEVDADRRGGADAVLVKARTSNLELLNTLRRVLQTPSVPDQPLPDN